MNPSARPTADDAASYYFTYIDRVPDGDVLAQLESGLGATRDLLDGISPGREGYRYAPDKWTVLDVIGHLVDTERVFGYRAFHIGRGDGAPLPGMEQDDYARNAGAERRRLHDLLDELEHLRRGHLRLFESFDDAAWDRCGLASGFRFRVSAIPWIMAGHEIHHRDVLSERYLS